MARKLETHKQDHKTIARVETAKDHLTVIELGEPVTMVAVGNQSAFLVERRGNKVFVKPTEEGAQTNLFIWTGTGRYAYELIPAKAVDGDAFRHRSGVADCGGGSFRPWRSIRRFRRFRRRC